MKATVMDMRRNPGEILRAIAKKEMVTLSHRGRDVARITPIQSSARKAATTHPAFGMWKGRDDMASPSVYVRGLRKGRFHDV